MLGVIGDIQKGGVVNTQVGSKTGGMEGANGLSPMGKGRDSSRGGRVLARGTECCT